MSREKSYFLVALRAWNQLEVTTFRKQNEHSGVLQVQFGYSNSSQELVKADRPTWIEHSSDVSKAECFYNVITKPISALQGPHYKWSVHCVRKPWSRPLTETIRCEWKRTCQCPFNRNALSCSGGRGRRGKKLLNSSKGMIISTWDSFSNRPNVHILNVRPALLCTVESTYRVMHTQLFFKAEQDFFCHACMCRPSRRHILLQNSRNWSLRMDSSQCVDMLESLLVSVFIKQRQAAAECQLVQMSHMAWLASIGVPMQRNKVRLWGLAESEQLATMKWHISTAIPAEYCVFIKASKIKNFNWLYKPGLICPSLLKSLGFCLPNSIFHVSAWLQLYFPYFFFPVFWSSPKKLSHGLKTKQNNLSLCPSNQVKKNPFDVIHENRFLPADCHIIIWNSACD